MGVDFIDYTYLQKRGFVKKEEPKIENVKITNDGFLDFNGVDKENNNAGASSSDDLISSFANASTSSNIPSNNEGASALSFFDNVPSTESHTSSFPSVSSSQSSSSDSLEVQGLKMKIDDLEYKLGNLLDKIEQINSKLLNFERKVESR